jgi:hypothetical protein
MKTEEIKNKDDKKKNNKKSKKGVTESEGGASEEEEEKKQKNKKEGEDKRTMYNERFEIYANRLIGKGSFGEIYVALDLQTRQYCALKHVNNQ